MRIWSSIKAIVLKACCGRPQMPPHTDCALTSVCRVAVVVNPRSAQPAETDQIGLGEKKEGKISEAQPRYNADPLQSKG
jgi:hypothetical protein